MIVHRLLSIDTLKYGRLELTELPPRGVILITGSNESGKSTIGETLCLALFGRTFALPAEKIGKAVRWDRKEAVVELDFAVRDRRLRVHRTIERSGTTAALLHEGDRELASGWAAVTAEVERALGYGFREFIESFYLARREIATPHPRSEAVRAMAGVLPMEQAGEDLKERLGAERERIEAAKVAVAAADTRLDELAAGRGLPRKRAAAEARAALLEERWDAFEAALPDLRECAAGLADAGIGTSVHRWQQLARRLRDGVAQGRGLVAGLPWAADLPLRPYEEVAATIERALGSYDQLRDVIRPRRRHLAGLLGEPGAEPPAEGSFDDQEQEAVHKARSAARARAALGAGAVGGGLVALIGAVVGFAPIADLQPEQVLGARIAMGVALAVVVWLALRIQKDAATLDELREVQEQLEDRRRQARQAAGRLDRFESLPPASGLEELADEPTPAIRKAVAEFRQGPGRLLLGGDARSGLAPDLEQAGGALKAAFALIRTQAEEDLRALEQLKAVFEDRDERVAEVTASSERVALWELSVDLLDGAAKELTFQFNRDVRRSMSRILPGLTEGRYQYLQIEDDFQVKVFSSEKQDFILYEEISGGTQRQVALATRVALSEGLVDNARVGPQFLFLDEPFAFFDAERTRISMAKLPHLSDTLVQIFVAAQEPPEGARWDLHIQTDRNAERLVVSGGARA